MRSTPVGRLIIGIKTRPRTNLIKNAPKCVFLFDRLTVKYYSAAIIKSSDGAKKEEPVNACVKCIK